MESKPSTLVTKESVQNELSTATTNLNLNTNQINLTKPNTQLGVQTSGSATGNPRNKCALRPGHSLMDWVRLGSSCDLAGTRGVIRPISHEELSKHNVINDAWLAIRGKVYNVTRYMDFHPGGVDELMKGVGRDATKLFDDVHAWVNYEQLLLKCFIGPLQNTATINLSDRSNNSRTMGIKQLASSTGPNGCFKAPFLPIFSAVGNKSSNASDDASLNAIAEVVPRFDWIQKSSELSLVFYTKPMCNAGIIVRCTNNDTNTNYEIIIQINHTIHTFTFEFIEPIDFPPINGKVSYETGKIELFFRKCKPAVWTNFGLLTRDKYADITKINSLYNVTDRVQITHDSYALVLRPTHRQSHIFPIGYHISITANIQDEDITRSYTPIPKSYMPIDEHRTDGHNHIYLLVKSYSDGILSPYITRDMPSTGNVQVSCAKGNFHIDKLTEHTRIVMLAAGSGITPMLPIIDFLLQRRRNPLEKLSLLYFNKSEEDVWCRNELTTISERDSRFQVLNFFSRSADANASGSGKMSENVASRLIDTTSEIHSTYCLICGPIPFNDCCVNLIRSAGFNMEHIFTFGS